MILLRLLIIAECLCTIYFYVLDNKMFREIQTPNANPSLLQFNAENDASFRSGEQFRIEFSALRAAPVCFITVCSSVPPV